MPVPLPTRHLMRLRWFCRTRPVLWWLMCVAATTGALLVWHQQVEALALQRQRLVRTEEVTVAVRDLAPGTMVTGADVRVEPRPLAFVPARSTSTLEQTVGQVVREPIMAGEPVVTARLARTGSTGVEALLGPSERAVAVPADDRTPPVQVGTPVDMVATEAADATKAATVIVVGGRVVAVRERAVVVAVPSQDLPAVASALARRAVVLALRTSASGRSF